MLEPLFVALMNRVARLHVYCTYTLAGGSAAGLSRFKKVDKV